MQLIHHLLIPQVNINSFLVHRNSTYMVKTEIKWDKLSLTWQVEDNLLSTGSWLITCSCFCFGAFGSTCCFLASGDDLRVHFRIYHLIDPWESRRLFLMTLNWAWRRRLWDVRALTCGSLCCCLGRRGCRVWGLSWLTGFCAGCTQCVLFMWN